MKVSDAPLSFPQLEGAASGHRRSSHPAQLGSYLDLLQILRTNSHATKSGTECRKKNSWTEAQHLFKWLILVACFAHASPKTTDERLKMPDAHTCLKFPLIIPAYWIFPTAVHYFTNTEPNPIGTLRKTLIFYPGELFCGLYCIFNFVAPTTYNCCHLGCHPHSLHYSYSRDRNEILWALQI